MAYRSQHPLVVRIRKPESPIMPNRLTARLLLAAALASALGLGVMDARGQVARLTEITIPVLAASGPVANDDPISDSARVVYEQDVAVPANGIARLVFGESVLSGSVAAGTGSFITITSALDGASQRLNAEHLQQWGSKTAYFNGPILTVRLHAFPGTGASRLSIIEAIVEDVSPFEPRTICGATDDRVPSTDNRQGRFAGGCTAWIINDTNSSLLTAGHCGASASSVMSFIVPLSTSTGGLVASHPDDQYVVDIASNQGLSGGTGNDWRNIGVFPNSNHGQTPFQRYGVRHVLASAAPAAAGVTLRITGYGTNASPMPRTLNQTQQTHTAASLALSGTRVQYIVDTTGGNSGSCVLNETTGQAIGIHTHGGCTSTGGSNTGTAIQLAGLQGALAAPLGVCASGNGTVAGTWYALGDRANNFGTVNAAPQKFAKIAQIGAEWQGLAFNPTLGGVGGAGGFYAVNESRQLFTMTTAGAATLLGTVTGPSNIITGLAFDPAGSGTLYAMQPSNGQLYRINLPVLTTTPIGGALGGTLRALEFDSTRNTLWGIDQAGGAAQLVRLNTTTGARTVIGPLGASIVSCADLACDNRDGSLRTINATTGELLAIDPATGAATVLGATGGVFGAAYGMASSAAVLCRADFNGDTLVSVTDIFAFLNAWFAGSPATDFNGVGGLTVQDIFDFLAAWFVGC